jgi:hypothetical protein
MEKSISIIASKEVAILLSPIQSLTTAGQIVDFIKELGWDLRNILASEHRIILDISQFTENLTSVITDVISLTEANDQQAADLARNIAEKIPELVTQAIEISATIKEEIEKIKALSNVEMEVIGLDLADAAELMARRLLDLLLYKYLQRNYQRIFSIFHLLGLAEIVPDASGMPIKTIQWHRIPQLFTEPGTIINDVYQWDTNLDFEGEKLLSRMEILLRAFLIPGGIYRQSDTVRNKLDRAVGDDKEIRVPLYQAGIWPDNYMEMDLNLSPIPEKDAGNKAGLFLYPYFFGGAKLDPELSENWELTFRGSLSTTPSIGLELRPPAKLNFVDQIFSGSNSHQEAADVQIEVGIASKAPKDELTLIFGSQESSRFGYKEFNFDIFMGLESGEFAFSTEARVNDLTLVIDVGDGDGFIQKILSGVVLESISDLTVGISSKEGFYFKGSSEFAITIPIHEQLGPIYLDSVKTGVGFGEEIKIILAVSFSLKLGPIQGTVKNIGLEIPLKITDDNSGNLGPINVQSPQFLPPEGAGLALDAGGLMGGGFLLREDDLYAGILALRYGDYSLTAVGLINTIMPDGSKGFSMVLCITVQFNPAIELSYGFSLKGVGGLIGIHRTVDTEFLREGLRAKTLDSILFPENPIGNAPKIISDMGNAFPVAQNRFVIGPMVKINWGGQLISIDVCILLEMPSPIRLVLLGQVAVTIPIVKEGDESTKVIVKLHLDVLGVLDIAKKELAIDATLYDSNILQVYMLYGDAALRLSWGDNADFAMSIGGFHPRFTPPTNFPGLRRLTIALADSSNLSLSCTMYKALTANSIQFGCNIQLQAHYSGADLDGYMSFDTIFYFSPFSFTADMRAGISVSYKGHDLASVRLSLELSGPTPWNAAGKASFEILAWDVDVDFEKTWGESEKRSLPAVDPLIPLLDDLGLDSSWGSSFLGVTNMESFVIDNEDQQLFMHPSAMLEIREKVLPLNLELDLYGNARVKDHKKFEIKSIDIFDYSESTGSGEESTTQTPKNILLKYIDEAFPRAPYFSISKQDKLSRPSFEKMPGGVVSETTEIGTVGIHNYQELEFENIFIDSERVSRKATKFTRLIWNRAAMSLQRSARINNIVGTKRYQHPAGKVAATTNDIGYVLVNVDTLDKIVIDGNTGLSYTMAEQLLRAQHNNKDEIVILPKHEVEAA